MHTGQVEMVLLDGIIGRLNLRLKEKFPLEKQYFGTIHDPNLSRAVLQ